MLNFDRAAIDSMIELGYKDARQHLCQEKGEHDVVRNICVLPSAASSARASCVVSA